MKKPIVVSIVMVLMLVMGGSFVLAQPQDSATEEKPTFYHLVPGIYVNGWPRFTIIYPKDWVEMTPMPQEIFRAGTVDPTFGERCLINVTPINFPYRRSFDHMADHLVSFFKNIGKDVTVISEKPSQLRDGTPAREVELQMIINGLPVNQLSLATIKGDMWIQIGVPSRRGRIREGLKAIVYSLEFQPDKDEPVKVPPDVQEFIDRWQNDIVSHDVTKVMTHYSDRYLDSRGKKGGAEQFWRVWIGPVTSFEVGITEFIAAGDRAYLTGFVSSYWGKAMLEGTSIIKESGEWMWYGNQRDVSR